MRIQLAVQTLRALGRGTLRLLAPPVCPACWTGAETQGFCTACTAALAFGAEARLCPRCGASLGPYLDAADGCFACRNDRFAFDTVVRLGRYHAALGQACQRIKHETQRPLAAALADLLLERRGEALRRLRADVVAPIPLHWRRRWRRGYNQADELAQRLARAWVCRSSRRSAGCGPPRRKRTWRRACGGPTSWALSKCGGRCPASMCCWWTTSSPPGRPATKPRGRCGPPGRRGFQWRCSPAARTSTRR